MTIIKRECDLYGKQIDRLFGAWKELVNREATTSGQSLLTKIADGLSSA